MPEPNASGSSVDILDVMKPMRGGPFGLKSRGLELEEHVFERTVFDTLQHGASRGQVYRLKDVIFDRCTVTTGPMWFSHGWDLENVRIEKTKAWRVMIGAQVPLRNVTVTSYAKAGRLEIKPPITTEGLTVRQEDHDDDYTLDVSGYRGDVWIAGVDADRVRTDPERHVKLRVPLTVRGAIEFPFLPKDSLARIAIGQMISLRVRDTILSERQVFEDPGGRDGPIAERMREAGILLDA